MRVLSMVLAAALLATSVHAETVMNLNALLGRKTLDSGDWDPLDKQSFLGVDFDARNAGWPISVAGQVLVSADKDSERVDGIEVDLEGSTVELSVGVRKIFPVQSFNWAIGGGLAAVTARLEGKALGETESDSDTGIGVWASSEAYFTVANRLNLGAMVRWSKAEVELFDEKGEAGGLFFGGLIGLRL